MMYQRDIREIVSLAEERGGGAAGARSADQREEGLDDGVEAGVDAEEEHAQDRRHHHHHEGGGDRLLAAPPDDLGALGADLVDELAGADLCHVSCPRLWRSGQPPGTGGPVVSLLPMECEGGEIAPPPGEGKGGAEGGGAAFSDAAASGAWLAPSFA